MNDPARPEDPGRADAASPADRWEAVMDGELSLGVAKEQGLFPQFDGAADAE